MDEFVWPLEGTAEPERPRDPRADQAKDALIRVFSSPFNATASRNERKCHRGACSQGATLPKQLGWRNRINGLYPFGGSHDESSARASLTRQFAIQSGICLAECGFWQGAVADRRRVAVGPYTYWADTIDCKPATTSPMLFCRRPGSLSSIFMAILRAPAASGSES
jgi:hypothetical protein